jgi:hypothetical protein
MSDATSRLFQASDAPWLVQQHDVIYARNEGFDASFGWGLIDSKPDQSSGVDLVEQSWRVDL